MSEIDLVRRLQLKASEQGHRLWRNNNGVGWVGAQVRVSHPQMVMMHPGDMLIRRAMTLHAGLAPGSSDLIGLTKEGRFIAAEVKAPTGRTSEGQVSFIEQVRRMNGIGLICRSIDDFVI